MSGNNSVLIFFPVPPLSPPVCFDFWCPLCVSSPRVTPLCRTHSTSATLQWEYKQTSWRSKLATHTSTLAYTHTGADYSKSWWGMEGVRMKVKETGGHGCRPSVASRRQHSHTNKMKVGATLLSRPQHTALCINMHHQRESRQVLTYHFMVPKAKQRKILLLKTDTTCSKSDTLQPRLVVEHGNTGNLGLTDSKNILSWMCFLSPDVY